MTRNRDTGVFGHREVGDNLIINGGFDFWQRGTSFSAVPNTYTADRWTARGTSSPNVTQIAQTSQSYSMRLQSTGAGTDTATQLVEGRFLNTDLTLTVGLSTNIGVSGDIIIFGNDGLVASQTPFVGTGSFQTITTSGTTGAGVVDEYLTIEIRYAPPAVGYSMDLFTVKLEQGPVATPFTRAGGTLAGELTACQRYYQVGTGNYFHMRFYAASINSDVRELNHSFATQMRVQPTVALDENTYINMSNVAPWSVTSQGFNVTWDYDNVGIATFVADFTADAEL